VNERVVGDDLPALASASRDGIARHVVTQQDMDSRGVASSSIETVGA
jgi:hypothetical protein